MSQSNPNYNPYAEPEFAPNHADLLGAVNEATLIRQQHISHEASVKSISLLYFISAFILVLLAVAIMVEYAASIRARSNVLPSLAVAGSIFAFGLFQGYSAWLIRRLQPLGRVLGTIVAAFGLIGFPMGTLISVYILFLLLSKKGSVVFSDEYKKVIKETPNVKYRTSIVVWILLVLLVLLIGLGVMSALFTARR